MEFPSACLDGLGSSFLGPVSIRLSRRPGKGGRAAVVECAGSGEMAPWAAAGPGARRHIRACRTRASALRRRSRNSGLQALLRARALSCPPHGERPAAPLRRRGSRESPSPKQLFPPEWWREKNKSAAAARSRRRNTSSSAWRRVGRAAAKNGRRSSLRCGRSDDVRAAPASISVCPPSSALALLFGLRRGVAVVTRSACGAVGGVAVRARLFRCARCVGCAGERWSFVVRGVDRAARPKRRRQAHDRSPVPARARLPRCSAPRHVSTADTVARVRVILSAEERGVRGSEGDRCQRRDVTTRMVARSGTMHLQVQVSDSEVHPLSPLTEDLLPCAL